MKLLGVGASFALLSSTCTRLAYPKKKLSQNDVNILSMRNAAPSEAVFIIPACLEQDSISATYSYQIRNEFARLGVPAFMIVDSTGDTRPEDMEERIREIQRTYHFTSITTLSLTHGELYDNKLSQRLDSASVLKPWDVTPKDLKERVTHYTRIGRSEMSGGKQETGALMKRITEAANVNGDLIKNDYVSFSCYSGAITQKSIDNLMPTSTYVALSGCNQVNYFGAQTRFLAALQHNRFDVTRGISALDFALETTRMDYREYDAQTVIGISGAARTIVLPAMGGGNRYYSETAFRTNEGQFYLLRNAGVTRSKNEPLLGAAAVAVQPK